MLLANTESENKRYDQFLLTLHANPMTDATARENYAKMIEPQSIIQAKMGEMVTDLDLLRRAKAEQQKGV